MPNETAPSSSVQPLPKGYRRDRQSVASTSQAWGVYGELGAVARRGWDRTTRDLLKQAEQMQGGLRFFAESAPLHLLRLLMEDATAQLALDNDLTIGFSPGSVRMVAVKDYRTGKGTIDDDGTAELARVFQCYDPTGGYAKPGAAEALMTLQRHAMERLGDTGQFMFEAVLGTKGEGVTQIVDFDPLTTRYRDDKTLGRLVEQRQKAAKDGWRVMNKLTTFTASWRGSFDNPFGNPRYGAWLKQGVRKLARGQNLHEWLHAVAWPRLVFQFDFDAAVEFAEKSMDQAHEHKYGRSFLRGAGEDGKDLNPYAWAQQQMNRFQDFLYQMESSDVLTVPSSGDVTVANASGIGGLSDILKMERIEEAQALLQLLNMLGVTDGGTQAYGEMQWNKYALSITSARSAVTGAAEGIGNLHFRALGLDLICRAEAVAVRPFDAQAVETTRGLAIANSEKLIRMGLASIEEQAILLTGSGVVDEERANKYFDAPAPTTTQTTAQSDPAPTADKKDKNDNEA